MSAIRQNIVEVDVTHGDCVPENKLGTGSDAWTKTYFVCAVEDFKQYAGFIEKQHEVSYRINRKRVEAYRILVREKFKDRFSQYRGKGEKFEGNCSALTSQTDDPVVGISIRVNGDRVFMKFADGRDPNAHALREILFENISRLMLQEVGDLHEIYPVIVYNELSLSEIQKSKSSECDDERCADWLTVALRLFQRQRAGDGGPNGWASYDAWAKAARETFAKADAGMLAAVDFDYVGFARKFVYNPTVANVYFKDHDANARAEVGNFISQNRQSPKAASWYTEKDNLPNAKGFGVGCALNFMMKVRPAEFATYSPMIDSALMFVGLLAKPLPSDPTVVSYEQNKSLQGQVLAKMHELHIGKAADDVSAADYLTVNEFAWWLSDEKNQDLIKEEIMKQNQIKAEPEKLKADGKKKLSDLIAGGPDSLMTMLTAALLAKPFAILAGASGTGKSRMVKKLAYMTCNADQLRSEKDETPGNYCMVAVKPNWHDSSELLGYRSAISESHEYITPDFIKFILRAHAFPKTPFFVCLDEMNLAPVEQYFAEFLSACESIRKNKEDEWVSDPLIQPGEFDKNVANLAPDYSLPDACIKRINERGLYIPHNLFVVGTVNMDDTTHQFSRKVLDRAMTLMMDDVDFGTLQNAQYEKLTNDLLMNGPDIAKFIDRGEFEGKDLEEDFKQLLGKLQTALKESPFAIGYRFAIESVLYRKALALLGIEAAALDATAADHMALMKILPRITGTLEERDAVLKNLADFFGALGEHKQSGDRLEKMKTAATQNGDYISFWP